MATAVLFPDQTRFPVGVTVAAYRRSNWSGSGVDPNGIPSGSSDGSAAVAADGSLTIRGLAPNAKYVAAYNVTGSVWRYFRFRSDGGVESASAALVANTVTTVTLPVGVTKVSVRGDGTSPIDFTTDGSTPTVNGADQYQLPAVVSEIEEIPVPAGSAAVIKLISAGTPTYRITAS